MLAHELDPRPALVIVGGHSFQDYTRYRDDVLATLPGLGLELGRDVILAGSISDAELHEWYRSADALVFPSLKEGWGLAVLEAMAADLPVVSSDIAVLREYLTPGPDRGDDPGRRSGVVGGRDAQAGRRPWPARDPGARWS